MSETRKLYYEDVYTKGIYCKGSGMQGDGQEDMRSFWIRQPFIRKVAASHVILVHLNGMWPFWKYRKRDGEIVHYTREAAGNRKQWYRKD